MGRITTNINPNILIWARKEMGLSVEIVSEKLGIPSEKYLKWEETGNSIPFGKLKDIGNIMKRQVAVFYLPETPPPLKIPKDYRNLDSIKSQLSVDVRKAIRNTLKFREAALELKISQYWQDRYNWELKINTVIINGELDNSALYSWLRKTLTISLENQIHFQSSSDAFRNWRNIIEEKLGIMVYQFSMPFDEMQGFCYSDYYPYVIAVNSKHSYTGRIFTIFHELGHIFKRQSGMCLPDWVEETQVLEYECNSFAGKFLVPENSIVPVDNLTDITKYANRLKISREVYLRRLLETKAITKNHFFELLDEIKTTYVTLPKKEKIIIAPQIRSKAERGITFYNMVIESVNNSRITFSTASELLGLNLTKLLSEL